MKTIVVIILVTFACVSHAQQSDFNTINFRKADSIASSLKDETLFNLTQLSYKLTANLNTDVERFRAIYKWVCENIANDYSLYLLNKRKRKRFENDSIKFKTWTTSFRKKLFRKLLKDQRTICTGYAYLVKELAELANLECELIQGYGRVSTTDIEHLNLPNHSWNAVKLNDKWYLCDPTWASGIPDPESNKFAFNYNDGFFLAHPELFAINHFPVEDKWWLLDKEIPTFEAFLASPIIYGNAYKNLNLHLSPKQMHQVITQTESVSFEYDLKKSIAEETISFYLDNGYNQWKTKPTYIFIDETHLTLKHRFKNRGFYDVHLYIDEDLISTYTIEVK